MADAATAQRADRPEDADAANSRPKKYVRTMTNKRREQNRRAQKVYRDKLKRKLEDLEEQVASTGADRFDESQAHNPLVDEEPFLKPTTVTQDFPSTFINFNDILEAGGDLPVYPAVGPSFHYPPPIPQPPQFDPEAFRIGSPNAPQSWPMPFRPSGTPYSPPPTSGMICMSGALTTISPSYAYTKQRSLLTANASEDQDSAQTSSTAEGAPFILHRSRTPSSSSSPSLPSPYANKLTFVSESNMAATLAVALSLGISRDAYLEDHPSQFPACFEIWWPQFLGPRYASVRENGDDLYSRFVIPEMKPTDTHCADDTLMLCPKWKAASWATVNGHKDCAPSLLQQHMSRIKSPLRPRPIQMMSSHPSYLDCIVFPRFRERAVQASVDGVLDHVEFFLDLMHGGLVCWAANTPASQGVNSRSRGRRRGMRDAVPWSTRSWEARRWFLDKWIWLVGTEAEEEAAEDAEGIWRSSRWWWAVRGEESSDEESGDVEDDDDSEEAVLRRVYQGVDGHLQGASRFDLAGIVREPTGGNTLEP